MRCKLRNTRGKMALRTLAGKWRAGTAVAAAIAAGGTVAYCEDPKGVGFDPEALERGAKALREINKSPYAKKVHVVRVKFCRGGPERSLPLSYAYRA